MKNTIKNKLTFLKKYFKENKKKSLLYILILIAVLYGIYKIFAVDTTVNKYVLGDVIRGDIVSTVSASGQVSATNQVELKSKNSGDIVSVNVTTGKEVKAGSVIAQVEAKDAWYSYQSAKISYEKLLKPADTISTLQAENGLANAKGDLNTYYAEAVTNIDNIYIDLPKIIDGLNTIFYTYNGTLNSVDEVSLPSVARTYKTQAGIDFDKAKKDFDNNFANYKSNNNQSSPEEIKKILGSTYSVVLSMTQAVKGTKNTLDYLQNNNSTSNIKNFSTTQNDVNNWLVQMNNHLTKLASSKNNINMSDKTIIEKEVSLQDVKNGSDALDIESARLNLEQRAAAYSDSIIKAPFDGVIAKVNVKKGDNVSSGVTIGTIITKQKIVTVDLNEVDISKIKVGQNANITFDAIDNFIATGTVVSVDGIGTVTQGVVSYNVKIVLNTNDERVLSGMSSSVVIDVDTKKDVITVPTAAVKTEGKKSYIEVYTGGGFETKGPVEIDKTLIEKRFVEVGLSDDTKTEIVSGLNEGEKIIVKTIATTASVSKTTTAPSLFGGASGARPSGTTGGATRSFNR